MSRIGQNYRVLLTTLIKYTVDKSLIFLFVKSLDASSARYLIAALGTLGPEGIQKYRLLAH